MIENRGSATLAPRFAEPGGEPPDELRRQCAQPPGCPEQVPRSGFELQNPATRGAQFCVLGDEQGSQSQDLLPFPGELIRRSRVARHRRRVYLGTSVPQAGSQRSSAILGASRLKIQTAK